MKYSDYTKTGLTETRFASLLYFFFFVILKAYCQETQKSGFASGEVLNTDGMWYWRGN